MLTHPFRRISRPAPRCLSARAWFCIRHPKSAAPREASPIYLWLQLNRTRSAAKRELQTGEHTQSTPKCAPLESHFCHLNVLRENQFINNVWTKRIVCHTLRTLVVHSARVSYSTCTPTLLLKKGMGFQAMPSWPYSSCSALSVNSMKICCNFSFT